MSYQRARTPAQVAQRKEQIAGIALEIYDTQGYQAVTFSAIAAQSNLTRPALYTYFENTDDILLHALGLEFEEVNLQLETSLKQRGSLTTAELAQLINEALAPHPRLLKMLSLNYSVIENGSSAQQLCAFKAKIMRTFSLLGQYVEQFFPGVDETRKVEFEFIVFSFISSVYILTHPSPKQLQAIAANDAAFTVPPFERLCLQGLMAITRALDDS